MAKRCRKEIPALARITDVLSHLLAQSRSRYRDVRKMLLSCSQHTRGVTIIRFLQRQQQWHPLQQPLQACYYQALRPAIWLLTCLEEH